MSRTIRWTIGLGIAPLLGYVAVASYLLVRIRPQPIVVPWKRVPEQSALIMTRTREHPPTHQLGRDLAF